MPGRVLGTHRLGSRPHAGEDDTIDEIIAMLGLGAVANVPAAALGLGTGRLVEIARALAARPRVVLLDEPSSGLDQRETEALAGVLRRLRAERGLAVVLVEHDVEMVLGVADAVTVLDFGRVIASGPPAEIRGSEIVQAAYLGSGL
jgi:ABC-type branched-subunit amino acid transport system ATPase component